MSTTATKSKPIRVQLRRTKGWRMPPNTVKVARPSKWGNPYKTSECREGAAGAVRAFRVLVESEPETVEQIRRDLRGKNLACYCPLRATCHADVLLELANKDSH